MSKIASTAEVEFPDYAEAWHSGGPCLTPMRSRLMGIAFTPIAAADIATTTGTLGESRQVSDGEDEGARLIWSSTTANPTASWRWWLWPDAEYGV